MGLGFNLGSDGQPGPRALALRSAADFSDDRRLISHNEITSALISLAKWIMIGLATGKNVCCPKRKRRRAFVWCLPGPGPGGGNQAINCANAHLMRELHQSWILQNFFTSHLIFLKCLAPLVSNIWLIHFEEISIKLWYWRDTTWQIGFERIKKQP